jgi:hypothetical protein
LQANNILKHDDRRGLGYGQLHPSGRDAPRGAQATFPYHVYEPLESVSEEEAEQVNMGLDKESQDAFLAKIMGDVQPIDKFAAFGTDPFSFAGGNIKLSEVLSGVRNLKSHACEGNTMRISVRQLKMIIKEEVQKDIEQKRLHPLAKGLKIKLAPKSPKQENSYEKPDDYDPEYDLNYEESGYLILDKNNKQVGTINAGEWFSYGELYGRALPDLEGYHGAAGPLDKSGILGKFHAFAKSKTGAKWFEVTAKKMQQQRK